MALRDHNIVGIVMDRVQNAWPENLNALEPRWFDVISKTRGWLPLDKGDKMTVTVDGETFQVKRIK